MKLKERHYWLGFNIFPGIGPSRFSYLLKQFGTAKKAFNTSKENLLKTNIPYSIIDKFLEFRNKINLSSEIIRLEKSLIRFIIIEDKEYPINLKKISLPPFVLYLKGRILPQDSFSIAVVGTRKVTPYGRQATEKLVYDLANQGLTIISGLARGVDSLAHRIALGNKSRTIAVLGSGLDQIYPPEHKALADNIINSGLGAIVSQLACGFGPLKGHFPARNRIIAGLALGVLVTEGASKSGAKITCEYALEQKKPIFAVPGPITSAMSQGPADLIKNGAKLVTIVEDILGEITITNSRPRTGYSNVKTLKVGAVSKNISFGNRYEEQIWQSLTEGIKHIDELIRLNKLSSGETLSCLTTMELKGMVKNIGGGNYIII